MRRSSVVVGASALCVAAGVGVSPAAAQTAIPRPTDDLVLPRNLTPAEAEYLKTHPIAMPRSITPAPTGPVFCPPEYAPMEGILLAWNPQVAAWGTILTTMAKEITTTGAAIAYIVVDSASEQSSVTSTLTAAGANMSRVQFMIAPSDTIWIRDYGPRYIFEGDCRAISDHTYNRPRPNDDHIPIAFAAFKHHERYDLPLIHGGGNFHLDALGRSYATRLVVNENPFPVTEAQIIGYWLTYQNVNTTLLTPYPTSVDSTQHLDMWMQIIDDNKVVISDWANPPVTTPNVDTICDNQATAMAAAGYTVYRVPAYSVGGVHYTFTNVLMCNNLVLVPTYTNGTASAGNATAAAVFAAALPGKTIVQVPCQSIVTSAGVMHCIAMHVPTPRGGLNPTTYVKTLNAPATFTPGQSTDIRWISDDDQGVVNVDVLLSLDGGATFPITVAAASADDGIFSWTVPNVNAWHARVKVLARDAGARTGGDMNDADLHIIGPCPGDLDGDGMVNSADLAQMLGGWGPNLTPSDLDGDGQVGSGDLAQLLGGWGACP